MWKRPNGTLWFRRVVPVPLREVLGQTEIRRSLRTKDPEEAKRRWKRESLRVDDLFDRARRGAIVQPSHPRVAAVDREIVRDYYTDKLEADDQLAGEEDDGSPRLRLKGEMRLPAHVRNRYLAFVQDDGKSPRVSEVLDRWITERCPSSKTEAEMRAAWTRMIALGLDGRQDMPVAQVTKAHIRQMKDRLLATKGRHMNTTISPVTAMKVIAAVKAVMQWATANGIIEANPCAGITVAGAKQRNGDKARLPYDSENLKKLFAVERKGVANYWLPYLGLYQGARLEELCQLRVEDIKGRTRNRRSLPGHPRTRWAQGQDALL